MYISIYIIVVVNDEISEKMLHSCTTSIITHHVNIIHAYKMCKSFQILFVCREC